VQQSKKSATDSLRAQSDVEETEGAFSASKYRNKVAQLKTTGSHRIDAISLSAKSACIQTSKHLYTENMLTCAHRSREM